MTVLCPGARPTQHIRHRRESDVARHIGSLVAQPVSVAPEEGRLIPHDAERMGGNTNGWAVGADAWPIAAAQSDKAGSHSPGLPHAMEKLGAAHWRPLNFPGGDEEDRTPDLRIANATLSQLSYVPERAAF